MKKQTIHIIAHNNNENICKTIDGYLTYNDKEIKELSTNNLITIIDISEDVDILINNIERQNNEKLNNGTAGTYDSVR